MGLPDFHLSVWSGQPFRGQRYLSWRLFWSPMTAPPTPPMIAPVAAPCPMLPVRDPSPIPARAPSAAPDKAPSPAFEQPVADASTNSSVPAAAKGADFCLCLFILRSFFLSLKKPTATSRRSKRFSKNLPLL